MKHPTITVAIGGLLLFALGAHAAEPAAQTWIQVDQPLVVPADEMQKLGTGDFSISVWAKADVTDRVTGDLLSQYDAKEKCGFHLTLKCNPGVTSNVANWRHLQFGIDDDKPSAWRDCGRPGNALFAFALATHEGALYAGTCEPGAGDIGHVYRYEGGEKWSDCGSLDGSNSVTALAAFEGALYAGTGKYRVAGSSLPESPNTTLGGRVFRHEGGTKWVDCGQIGDDTQTYAFTSYEGRLHVAMWPSGRVYRFEDVGRWTDIGRLGTEKEVMGMMVHNGCFIGGTLPLAEVHAYDDDGKWSLWQRLDHTPDVKYRRAWTMAEHAGEVFCSTLPSGKVWAARHGRQVSWDHSLPSGWHHIAAVKSTNRLTLHVDGKQVAESTGFDASAWNLDTDAPLRLGTGMNGPFNGQLRDLQIHRRTLTAGEIEAMLAKRPAK